MIYKNSNNEVFSVVDDSIEFIAPDDWLEISEETALLMSQNPSKYHEWQEETQSWFISIENQELLKLDERAAMPDLTRVKFKQALLDFDFDLYEIEAKIEAIEDKKLRNSAMLEWREAYSYERMNPRLLLIAHDLLNLTDDDIDKMWHHAMTL